ncbi:unnamed protein product [Pseudo-nitzschia multistriata]|uniref:Major facilitator superfamily (MFS) profile domain-containing protein n=1 Tax=Pseudo-nitzschia multistriata TaxID=183589 RepID=A0A448YV61_9STRA|nr:unnamed protein product [Pseudo-nitzschia multistriata]
MSGETTPAHHCDQQRSSLLAEALDLPVLDHRARTEQQQEQRQGSNPCADRPPPSACPGHSGNPCAEESNLLLSQSPALLPEAGMTASFDTPVIRNHKLRPPAVPPSIPTTPTTTMPTNPVPIAKHPQNGHTETYLPDDTAPRHSDFTVPTSNSGESPRAGCEIHRLEPPMAIAPGRAALPNPAPGSQRSILGSSVGKKYHCSETDRKHFVRILPGPSAGAQRGDYGSIMPPPPPVVATTTAAATTTATMRGPGDEPVRVPTDKAGERGRPALSTATGGTDRSSRMLPKVLPAEKDNGKYDNYCDQIERVEHQLTKGSTGASRDFCHPERQSLLFESNSNSECSIHQHCDGIDGDGKGNSNSNSNRHHYSSLHKSVHAQSLLVGLAFMVIWLPNNAMAPNLTQMAKSFDMNDAERDLYLGSYCALALGVFSLPLSGFIGFMADFHSRKNLFLACCVFGALSSAWTGWSPNYPSLFLARLCNGGCMSGSVPVAFSLLGDLFSKEERNAASSGLTSMMGMGITLGQIYAGEVGPTRSWQYPFYASASVQLVMAMMIALWVEEPIRGGKEQALQGVFKSGNKYERQLTMKGFADTMRKNASNWILLWYGFFTSLPWGIVFVFLNDYLSQEKGFSVQEATFLVMLFGVGCAIGGLTGGYLGQLFMRGNRSNLPLYMAVSTFLGIFPFLLLLNSEFPNHNGIRSKFYSVLGGCIASLPSVNVRPCIINVNPPESRGAALTAANLFVTLGRGIGPCCITLLGSVFSLSRQSSFNTTLLVFWTIAAAQMLFLAKTLPEDQDRMEEALARYAATAQGGRGTTCEDGDPQQDEETTASPLGRRAGSDGSLEPITPERRRSVPAGEDDGDEALYSSYSSMVSSPPAQYMTIDRKTARQSIQFVRLGIQEFGDEITYRNTICRGCDTISPCPSQDDLPTTSVAAAAIAASALLDDHHDEGDDGASILQEDHDTTIPESEIQRRRDLWRSRQQEHR